MVESVGKKLNQARLKRGLTIDEAAHATKLRPDKIAALEADDYSRFANNIYAKGFLQIYARYLNVDVSDFARTLDNANPISVSDYQYLSNAQVPRRETTHVERNERKAPSLAPLFVFAILIVLGGFAMWIYTKSLQISGEPLTKTTPATEVATPAPTATPAPVAVAPTAITPTPAPVEAPRPQVLATPIPQPLQAAATPSVVRSIPTPIAATTPSVVRAVPTPTAAATPYVARVVPTPTAAVTPYVARTVPTPTAVATPSFARPGAPTPLTFVRSTPLPAIATSGAGTQSPNTATSDQDFVRATPIEPTTNPAPAASVNEVQVAAIRTTYITVRKDDPKSSPIFEGQIYSSARPLKLKGARFFIDARDPNSVQITKNGLPVAYQAPNVPVQ